jgi:nitrite reductase/ring-hydroxylating ferredoxin subunit
MSTPQDRRHWLRLSDSACPLKRRRFLTLASGTLLAASTVARAERKLRTVDAGTINDLTEDGISEKYTKDNFFLIRHQGQIFATIATCPHKGNFLLRDPQNPNRVICSGHDSEFDITGVPIAGRVKKGLTRFGISVNEQGRILVTPDLKFEQKDWSKNGSFIAAKRAQ